MFRTVRLRCPSRRSHLACCISVSLCYKFVLSLIFRRTSSNFF
ncbi:hypothetical protein M758_4G190800 [Ceratodon purpureus]|nr:hypothetical protein M758_4G190800 [Ceratodon purpureus]